jgi:glutamate/aspartate transport system permease protein
MIAAAYLAEVIRAGLASVPPVQRESAYAAGLTPAQSFVFVVLPQGLRNMLPALVAHLVMMFKITSLVYVIGLIDFFRAVILVNNREFAPYALYMTMGAVYFLCCWAMSLVVKRLDPKYTLVS